MATTRSNVVGICTLVLLGAWWVASPTKEELRAKEQKAAAEWSAGEAARAEQRVAEQKAAAEKNAACARDLKCLADKHLTSATVECARPIERLAKYSVEWTNSWVEGKLSHFRWLNKDRGHVTYLGDRIKFQNGFGAWQPHTYECDFDTKSNRALAVRASPGRYLN